MREAASADSGVVNLGFARVDTDRKRRCGFPEVIFGAGKTSAEVLAIAREILARDPGRFAALITHTRPLDQIDRAFAQIERYEDGVGKLIIRLDR